jgi:hypothetical protein
MHIMLGHIVHAKSGSQKLPIVVKNREKRASVSKNLAALKSQKNCSANLGVTVKNGEKKASFPFYRVNAGESS